MGALHISHRFIWIWSHRVEASNFNIKATSFTFVFPRLFIYEDKILHVRHRFRIKHVSDIDTTRYFSNTYQISMFLKHILDTDTSQIQYKQTLQESFHHLVILSTVRFKSTMLALILQPTLLQPTTGW